MSLLYANTTFIIIFHSHILIYCVSIM